MKNFFKKQKKISREMYMQNPLQRAKNFSFDGAKIKHELRMEKIKNTINKIKIFLKDHFYLLVKSSAENHLRIQECRVRPEAGESCNLAFQSYSDLKKYQKKVRLFTYSFSSTIASVMILVFAMQIFFPANKSLGASYMWRQSDWLTQSAVDNAEHNPAGENTTWTKYSSKDASIAAGDVLALSENQEMLEKKSDTDFNAAGSTFTNSSVSGTGEAAGIVLGKEISQVVNAGLANYALTKDGDVYAWGAGSYGRMGQAVGDSVDRYVPVKIASLSADPNNKVVSIIGGSGHTLALKKDGTLWAWGSNSNGQLGVGDTTEKYVPTQVSITGVVSIAAGDSFSLAVKNDGTVYAWGYNLNGQLGNGGTTNASTPQQVGTAGNWLSGVVAVAASASTSYAIKNDGTLWVWGINNGGQLGIGTTGGAHYVPELNSNINNIKTVRAVTSHVLALKNDGTVFAWGLNSSGQLGINSTTSQYSPTLVSSLTNVVGIGVGYNSSFAMTSSGQFYAWGNNVGGELGIGTSGAGTNKLVPELHSLNKMVDVSGRYNQTAGTVVALKSDGSVWTWGQGGPNTGNNDYATSQTNTNPVRVKAWMDNDYIGSVASPVSNIAGTSDSALAIKGTDLWVWGRSNGGQLGLNDTANRYTPFQNTSLSNVSEIASADSLHSLVLAGGNVYAWGSNSSYQVSSAYGAAVSTPQLIPNSSFGNNAIAHVGSGAASSFAITTSGALYGWGKNDSGQLGIGANTPTLQGTPLATNLTSGVQAVTGGATHTLAIKDGAVYSFGTGNFALGLGATTTSYNPTQVNLGGNTVQAIAAGNYHSMALTTDGKVYTWGANNYGQLGIGNTTNQNVPQLVIGSGVVAIAAGQSNSLALMSDGTVKVWGRNTYGQIGDDTTTDRNIPTSVPSLSGVSKISAGRDFCLAIKNDGTLWAWGLGDHGRLGVADGMGRKTPVKVWGTPSGYINLGAGYKTSGTYESPVYSIGKKVTFTTLGITGTIQAPTTGYTFDVGAGESSNLSDGTWTWQNGISDGSQINISGKSYVKYRVNLTTNDGFYTPMLDGVALNYKHYDNNPYTKLLIHADATGSFLDSSLRNHTITTNGNVTQSATQSKFGGKSAYFDGNNSYLSMSDSEDWNFGTGDFSVDFWVNFDDVVSSKMFFVMNNNGAGGSDAVNYTLIMWRPTTGLEVDFMNSSVRKLYQQGDITGWSPGTWYHIAVSRSGNTVYIFRDGQQMGTLDVTGFALPDNNTTEIGRWVWGGSSYHPFKGYLDEFRISKGIARWAGAFSVPTEAYNNYFSLISSPYNTGSDFNTLSQISWTETLPSNTDAKFQARTSSDNVTWTSWMGPDGSSSSYFTDPAGTESVPLALTDGTGDRWIQYKAFLSTTDTAATPSVSQINLRYIVNAPPVVSLLSTPSQKTISESPSGVVDIAYNLVNGGVGDQKEPLDKFNAALFYTTNSGTGLTSTNSINNSATTISLTGSDGQYLPNSGFIQIDDEVISYSGKSGSGTSWTLTGCTRGTWQSSTYGTYSTIAASHNAGATVFAGASNSAVSTTSPSGGTGIGDVRDSSGNPLQGDRVEQSYGLRWDPANDAQFGDRYEDTLIVKVVVNDGNAASQLGSAASTAFAVDTKNPANATFSIDHANNALIIKNPSGSVEDSQYEILASTTNSISSPTPAQVLSFAAAKNYPYTYNYSALSGLSDPVTIYVWLRDQYGNTTPLTQTTLIKPTFIQYFDISKSSENYYAELISWKNLSSQQNFSGYHLYRAVTNAGVTPSAGDYTLYQSDISTNYFTDNELDSTKKYSYKVATVDTSDNTSVFTEVASDQPDGVGGSNLGNPIISNAAVSNRTTTSMKVTWDTNDGLTTGTVSYKRSGTADEPTVLSVPDYEKNHSYVITGLLPNQQYEITIASQMLDNSTDTEILDNASTTTVNGPRITNVAITDAANDQATIYWKTDVNSDSTVAYSTAVSNGSLANPTTSVTGNSDTREHYVNLTSLIPGQKYFFQVQSGTGTNNNGEEFFELNTSDDLTTAPTVTTGPIKVSQSSTSAVITWTTNQPATTSLQYKISTSGTWTTIPDPASPLLNRNHSVALTGLAPNTQYDYRIHQTGTKNINNVTLAAVQETFNFTTDKSADQNHDPIANIANIQVPTAHLMDKSAVITFDTTDANSVAVGALCLVELEGTSGSSITSTKQYEAGYDALVNYNASHAIPLKNLTPSTTYTYTISCHDNIITDANAGTIAEKYGNWASSSEGTFTTKEELFVKGDPGLGGDSVPPVITNVKVASTTGESATITWDTDEEANSIARFGIATVDEQIAGDSVVNKSIDNYTSSHKVVVNGLVPGTKYVFVASSTDASGNIAESSQSEFTTASPSSLSSIKAQSLDLGQATITWQTDQETTSIVEYGLTTSYGEKKESSTYTKDHSINLSNLNQGEIYHYRVKGKDTDGKLYSSSDQTFEPKSPPQISDISINEITEHEAVVRLKTNVPTTATAIYTSVQNPDDNGSQSDSDMKAEHVVRLKNLIQGTTYNIKIQVSDEQGTQNEQTARDFTTGRDENPPKIDQVHTDAALTQSDKVQAIISWKTDEQSDTALIYKEGRNGAEKEVKISDNLTTNHVAVITVFKPGTVYYFKVKSTDASKNTGTSNDFALLTPKRKENIIQIIINNFQDIFGWARR